MREIIRYIPILLLAGFIGKFHSINAQATTTLSIDSVNQLGPIILDDTTGFQVRVRVNSLLGPDSLTGDIFYYYRTDSMINSGAPARIFQQDAVIELVYDQFIDTVLIDIRPDEIRTDPLNLIVIWPAMINPSVADTDSIAFYVGFDGYFGIEEPTERLINPLYPLPAMEYLYVRPSDADKIELIHITNMQGQTVMLVNRNQLSSGWIHVGSLPAGLYNATITYNNGQLQTTRILKQPYVNN